MTPVPARVVIVGGARLGCEVAGMIAGFNNRVLCLESSVTIEEAKPAVAIDENPAARMLLRQRLRDKG